MEGSCTCIAATKGWSSSFGVW